LRGEEESVFQLKSDGIEIAGSTLYPSLGLGFFMRGKSILFESRCFMEWIIGIREFEIFLRIVRGCKGAWSFRIF
jgi:hypothetical protein